MRCVKSSLFIGKAINKINRGQPSNVGFIQSVLGGKVHVDNEKRLRRIGIDKASRWPRKLRLSQVSSLCFKCLNRRSRQPNKIDLCSALAAPKIQGICEIRVFQKKKSYTVMSLWQKRHPFSTWRSVTLPIFWRPLLWFFQGRREFFSRYSYWL